MGFCAIFVCISPSSSSSYDKRQERTNSQNRHAIETNFVRWAKLSPTEGALLTVQRGTTNIYSSCLRVVSSQKTKPIISRRGTSHHNAASLVRWVAILRVLSNKTAKVRSTMVNMLVSWVNSSESVLRGLMFFSRRHQKFRIGLQM
jgi:hypothetical protein